jgi:Spy/CpxP family protein refolding chaperone
MKLLGITGAIVGLAATSSIARAHDFDHGLGRWAIVEKLATLGITDAQRDEIRAILRKHQPTVEPMVKQLVVERRALRDVIHAETIDEKAIRKQAGKIAGIQADLAVQRAHVAREIRDVLTDDQLAKLAELGEDADARLDAFVERVAKRIAAD